MQGHESGIEGNYLPVAYMRSCMITSDYVNNV